ncbi:MAG TPA: hypothetical protein VNJ08_10565 [Bacteriovoracaceae bacterium]|nr:hypothetical protein [Bacteriovoracaceae bacterium]
MKTVKLESAKIPKMMSDLIHSNQFLKIFSIISSMITLSLVIVHLMQMYQGPVVITLNQKAEVLTQDSLPKAEVEIEKALREYIKLRYFWSPKTVNSNLKEAQVFILPNFAKVYEEAMAGVVKFSKEKMVSQKVYPEVIEVNLAKKVAFVRGDRITAFQNIRATGELKLTLYFESGMRTEKNPWGVYISKVQEEAQ